jgi:hypothetical protein
MTLLRYGAEALLYRQVGPTAEPAAGRRMTPVRPCRAAARVRGPVGHQVAGVQHRLCGLRPLCASLPGRLRGGVRLVPERLPVRRWRRGAAHATVRRVDAAASGTRAAVHPVRPEQRPVSVKVPSSSFGTSVPAARTERNENAWIHRGGIDLQDRRAVPYGWNVPASHARYLSRILGQRLLSLLLCRLQPGLLRTHRPRQGQMLAGLQRTS